MGGLVLGHLVLKSLHLSVEAFFHFMVGCLIGPDCFKQSFTYPLQGDGINFIANGIKGCDNGSG
jgi:hypothetical protein